MNVNEVYYNESLKYFNSKKAEIIQPLKKILFQCLIVYIDVFIK